MQMLRNSDFRVCGRLPGTIGAPPACMAFILIDGAFEPELAPD